MFCPYRENLKTAAGNLNQLQEGGSLTTMPVMHDDWECLIGLSRLRFQSRLHLEDVLT